MQSYVVAQKWPHFNTSLDIGALNSISTTRAMEKEAVIPRLRRSPAPSPIIISGSLSPSVAPTFSLQIFLLAIANVEVAQ